MTSKNYRKLQPHCLNKFSQLNEQEKQNAKNDYDILKKTVKPTDITNSTINVFPGCAEKSDKEDPTGDFIIYHEMVKYAQEKKQHVVFLTYDNSKGDWLSNNGQPHWHYIENFYNDTGQILFIIDADRLFKDLYQTSFESLIKFNLVSEEEIPLTTERLSKEVDSYAYIASIANDSAFTQNHIQELNYNGVYFLAELKAILSKNSLYLFFFDQLPFNGKHRMFYLRILMILNNIHYKMFDDKGSLIKSEEVDSCVKLLRELEKTIRI